MGSFPLLDLQSAVIALLGVDDQIVAFGWKVLDFVGERMEPPYIVVGSEEGFDNSAKLLPGMRVEIELDFWSTARGYKQTKQVMSRAYDLLHLQNKLTVNGGNLTVRSRVSHVSTKRDEDGIKRHGIMRVEVITFNSEQVGA